MPHWCDWSTRSISALLISGEYGVRMMLENVSGRVEEYWRERNSVVGAFWDLDFLLFDRILRMQFERDIPGDLLEIGALYGKSAIVLGLHARPAERMIVCDVFDDAGGDAENTAENLQSYNGLTRGKFEENYSRWVHQPPVVIAEPSEHIAARLAARSLRFAHVDGGHLYSVVRADIANVRGLMNDSGVVVMDDIRQLHTPGVAAAVWEAVANGGLIPISISEQKFYGAWNPDVARATRECLTEWAAAQGETLNYGTQLVAGAAVLVIENPIIWSLRTRVERFVPPILSDVSRRGAPRPYLGSR
jgi:hypothetical protein